MADAAAVAAQLAERGKADGIRFFQFSFVDLFGVQRSKLVPASRVQEIGTDGAGFAGFAAWLDMEPTDGDLLALPDPSTYTKLPWNPEVAWLACNLVHNDAELEHGPRNVLRKAIAELEKRHGLSLKVGVEVEFFLLEGSSTPETGAKLGDAMDIQGKPCYDAHALMRRYDLISELMTAMEALGWGPYQADHEDANGQFEINWDYADALVTADRQVFFKYMVRSLAEKRGLRATFMAKPFLGLTGSGAHCHSSLHDAKTGANVMGGGDASTHGLGDTALKFLGGLLAHAPALAALTNPTVNSYKRLNASSTASGATWSPNAVTWAGNNRTALVRVPGGPPRIEVRLADISANPYLLPAALLAGGMDGLAGNAAKAGPPVDFNMFKVSDPRVAEARKAAPKLPQNLSSALDLLEACKPARELLGEGFVGSYVKLRRAQWEEYCAQLTRWELETYLDA